MALASVLLVVYVNIAIVAHADDSQAPPVDQCSGDPTYDCQPVQDNTHSAPVVDLSNPYFGNNTYYGNSTYFG